MSRREKTARHLTVWVADRHEAIMRSIEEYHEPGSTGTLARYLREIKDVLFSRRALSKNLVRLEDLLTLCQLRLNHLANEAVWGCSARSRR